MRSCDSDGAKHVSIPFSSGYYFMVHGFDDSSWYKLHNGFHIIGATWGMWGSLNLNWNRIEIAIGPALHIIRLQCLPLTVTGALMPPSHTCKCLNIRIFAEPATSGQISDLEASPGFTHLRVKENDGISIVCSKIPRKNWQWLTDDLERHTRI